ncbi:divalent-cation tolerance protein CutA [Oligella ureolytica]|jgi:periplasmic divalent cation tolerance protein|nr:divalent-cation tolerance protein CutA [Alcaligenaceae bacterium]HZJ98053.1 divalent-cation tolerance protein CutA [Oligella sp.]
MLNNNSILSEAKALIIQTTTPTMELAKLIAGKLVEESLAACVNLSAPSLSIYSWESKLHSDEEFTLTIKTSTGRQADCINRIQELHSYDVPEIIVLPIIGGSEQYLQWIADETR